MQLREFVKRQIRNYFIIFAIIVISITLLRQFFAPNAYFSLNDIYIFMICALAATLTGFILYTSKEQSEKEMRTRMILHFFVLEVVIMILANIIGVVSGVANTIFLAVQIAFIYGIIRLLLYRDDKNVARKINEKLNELKNETSDEGIGE